MQADCLLDEIADKFSLLAGSRQLGSACPDIAAACRYFPVGAYFIVYCIISDGIEVSGWCQARRLQNIFPGG